MGSQKFHANYDGGGMVTLHCPRCGTHESGTPLKRVHDHARIHHDWWHDKPIPLSRAPKLEIIDCREHRRLR